MQHATAIGTVTFREQTFEVHRTMYQHGGIALMLFPPGRSHLMHEAIIATKHLSGLWPDEAAIKDYSELHGMYDALVAARIVAPHHREEPSGFVLFPICRLLGAPPLETMTWRHLRLDFTAGTATGPCSVLGREYTVHGVTRTMFDAYRSGAHIQEAFADLSAEDREFIQSGVSPEGWDRLYGKGLTDEELSEAEGEDAASPPPPAPF